MKTFKEWEENFPNLELSQYLQPMDEVDEELYLHAGEIAPPAFCFDGFVQMCDADYEKHGIFFYMTFSKYNDKYYYLGILPEFLS